MGDDGCEMLSVAGNTGWASVLFTMIYQEVPPGPPDIPKLREIVAKCNVHIGE